MQAIIRLDYRNLTCEADRLVFTSMSEPADIVKEIEQFKELMTTPATTEELGADMDRLDILDKRIREFEDAHLGVKITPLCWDINIIAEF